MASETAVLTRQHTLSMGEISALADRLESYAKIVLSTTPAAEFANDAWVAGKALRAMMRAHHSSDVINVAA